MSKRASQKRGVWKKDKADRGVYRRGGTWYCRYTDQHGRLHKEAVGPSKATALAVYRKRKTEVAEHRFFPELRREVTFDEIMRDAIIRARQDFALKYPGRKFHPRNYGIVAGWFAGWQASSVTPQEIAAKLAERCKTPATFNRYRIALSHAYKLAIESRKVAENPALLVKLQRENNERVRWLEPEEEQALRAVLQKKFPRREPELDLALHTGLRWGEQYALRWDHVDLKLGLITIPRAKSGRRERVPINSEARRALARLRAIAPKSETVCPHTSSRTHRLWWYAARAEAKLVDFHWHDLRHTFASRLVMNGVDILTVSKLLRHRTLGVTMRYAHLAATHLRDAVEKLVASVPGSVPGARDAAADQPQLVH